MSAAPLHRIIDTMALVDAYEAGARAAKARYGIRLAARARRSGPDGDLARDTIMALCRLAGIRPAPAFGR